MEKIIVTTTNNIDGYVITEYLDPVTSNIVVGTNIICDLLASFSDTFGTRSNAYQEKLKELYQLAIAELKEEARKMGANCIIGMKIDFDEISGIGKQMFMLNSIGTAVIAIEKSQYKQHKEAQKIKDEENQAIEEAKRAKFKTMEDLLNDKEIVANAQEIKRIYGEKVYKEFLESKIKELR